MISWKSTIADYDKLRCQNQTLETFLKLNCDPRTAWFIAGAVILTLLGLSALSASCWFRRRPKKFDVFIGCAEEGNAQLFHCIKIKS